MIRIGVIGYGYWGPNIVRNISRLPNATVTWVCDLNPILLKEIPFTYPTIKTTQQYNDLLSDPSLDAVIIATPISTHVALARQAIVAGKHVVIEKPMTLTARDARGLITLAKRHKRILMVDHTFVYTPAIVKLKSIISSGQLGRILYVDSVRMNLGILQKDANVIYDLATHDFSIMDYLFNQMPKTVSATGIAHKELKQETVAHLAVTYPNDLFFHCQVSWLSPIKIRRMIFVGSKKMLTYDDIDPSEKLKIYDKGVSFIKDPKQSLQLRIGYRSGSAVVPHINIEEGLFNMLREFVTAIQKNRQPLTDGAMGLRVVTCLEAATKSLRTKGKLVTIR